MKNPVLIKGNKYGISLALDQSLEFNELLEQIGQKFKDSAKFFDSSHQTAISFEGRILSNEEIQAILDTIKENCDLDIAYVIDNSEEINERFQTAIALNDALKQQMELQEKMKEQEREETSFEIEETYIPNCDDGRFYKGTLRSGQAIDSDSSIIIIGDVNPGASVTAKGNIIVLGCLKGTAFAGSDGNEKSFVAALDMIPMQIRIGNVIARAPDNSRPKKGFFKREQPEAEAKIAYVEEQNIYIEPISKTVLSDLKL